MKLHEFPPGLGMGGRSAEPNHMPVISRSETGDYVAGCSCGWIDCIDYADVKACCAAQATHLMHPDLCCTLHNENCIDPEERCCGGCLGRCVTNLDGHEPRLATVPGTFRNPSGYEKRTAYCAGCAQWLEAVHMFTPDMPDAPGC